MLEVEISSTKGEQVARKGFNPESILKFLGNGTLSDNATYTSTQLTRAAKAVGEYTYKVNGNHQTNYPFQIDFYKVYRYVNSRGDHPYRFSTDNTETELDKSFLWSGSRTNNLGGSSGGQVPAHHNLFSGNLGRQGGGIQDSIDTTSVAPSMLPSGKTAAILLACLAVIIIAIILFMKNTTYGILFLVGLGLLAATVYYLFNRHRRNKGEAANEFYNEMIAYYKGLGRPTNQASDLALAELENKGVELTPLIHEKHRQAHLEEPEGGARRYARAERYSFRGPGTTR